MTDSRHWDEAYARLGTTGVSWYQAAPAVSRRLIELTGVGPEAPIIDVGGGESPLVEGLLAGGARDVTVLDISPTALERLRERLGAGADRVHWIRDDVRDWEPDRAFALWHDRAVFHFMVSAGDRERYLRAVRAALPVGGHVVLGVFAADGPTRCSGLPVARYGPQDLAAAFGDGFRLTGSEREEHHTPGSAIQPFTWVTLRRVAA